jgi:hypothetical protein
VRLSFAIFIEEQHVATKKRLVYVDFQLRTGVRPPDAFAGAFRAVSTPPPKDPKTKESPPLKAIPFDILKDGALWRPRPPVRYLVDGFLPVGSLGMLCALGSSHKSWMLVDMALAVAKGRRWLETFQTGKPLRVLYMDYENNEDETARRVIGLEQQPILNFHAAIMPDMFLTNPKFLSEIDNIARHYDFVAIDSLSGGSEDVDENVPKFAQSLKRMKRAGAKTSCGFVVLHHSRKPQRDRNGDEIEDTNKKSRPRGTTAIYAAADSILDIDNLDNNRSRVTHTKNRGSPRYLDPFTICLEGEAPKPTRIFVLSNLEIETAKETARLQKRLTHYRKKWDGKGISANGLFKLVGGQKATVLAELKAFVKFKLLSLEDGLFSVPSEANRAGTRGGSKKGASGNHLKLVPVPSGSDDREPVEPAS